MSSKMIKLAKRFRRFVTERSGWRSSRFSLLMVSMAALLAAEATAAVPAIKVRNGVPNAALFARRWFAPES